MSSANATYNLNDAVADTATERDYVLSEDENVDTTLGTMGGTNATLTIDGSASKFGINGASTPTVVVGGITVGSGNTLILQNLGSVTISGEGTAVADYTVNASINGFLANNGSFVNNNGTMTISDVVFSGNKATDTGGGVIYNNNVGNITEISNAIFIGNDLTASHAYGGVIYNTGTFTQHSLMGNISGKFVNNNIEGVYYGLGVIGNVDGEIKNISADFIGNTTSAQWVYGGQIYNGVYYTSNSKIGDISGNFENNTASADGYLMGSSISNTSSSIIGNISADFKNNKAIGGSSATVGGVVSNLNSSSIGDISGNFENNELSGNTVYGIIYNQASSIGVISGDFKGNVLTGNTVYGGVMNSTSTASVSQIIGSTFEGNVANGTSVAIGAAITNLGNITNGIVNAKFLDNAALSDTDASGAAIYTSKNINIIADGSIGDGISTFKGNYYQVTGQGKIYEAIWMSGSSRILTLEAKNNGVINLYDHINGSSGYDTVITGDSTGTVNLYNDVRRSDVTVNTIKICTTDGNSHDYAFNSLNSNANAKWEVDFDVKNKTADTFATNPASATASAGTVTLTKLNLINGEYTDVSGADFKIQILKTQGTETEAGLQLALSDDLKAELEQGYVTSVIKNTVIDEVTDVTKWTDEFKEVGTITTTTDKLGLATTTTLNDSIGVISETITVENVDRKLGDTLALVNQANLAQKTFTATTASDVYKAEEDLGQTFGNLTINGVADGEQKSTIDLSGFDGFEIVSGANVTLNNTKLTDTLGKSALTIETGGKMCLLNATTENVDFNIEGELDTGNSKVTAKNAVFGASSQLTLRVDSLNNYGSLSADSFDITDGAKIDITFGQNPLDGKRSGEVALLTLSDGSDINNNNFIDNFHNNMFNFSRKSEKSGIYEVAKTETAEEISRAYNGTKTNQSAASAWIDQSPEVDGITKEIADGLFGLAQTDGAAFNEALTAIAPNDNGMIQTLSTDITDRLMITVDNHLYDPELEKQTGMASGDSYYYPKKRKKDFGAPDLSGITLWAKGYYGKSKLQRRANIYGFDADNHGIIAAVDKKMTSNVKVGGGIQYDISDVDGFKRNVNAKTTLGFLYSEYRPSKWFVSGVVSYGSTDYDERKYAINHKISAHYRAEIYSFQGLTGYTFKYFTPEIGARYYKIRRHGYIDSIGQKISGQNMDLLRIVAGVRTSGQYEIFKPIAYLEATYDAVSDRDNAIVSVGKSVTYNVYGKRLPRFGVEFGVGIVAEVTDKFGVSFGYETKFREKYQDHIGMMNARYEF